MTTRWPSQPPHCLGSSDPVLNEELDRSRHEPQTAAKDLLAVLSTDAGQVVSAQPVSGRDPTGNHFYEFMHGHMKTLYALTFR